MPIEDVVRGNVRHATLLAPSLTPTALTASTTTSQTFTIPGLQTTHYVFVNFQGAQTAGVGIANAYVSATDTLTIVFSNSTAGTPTPAAGVYGILVCSRSQNPLPTIYV
jgi:hypothetical protein